jgi:hypothetical protein
MRKLLLAVVLSAFALTGCFERPVVEEGNSSATKTETPAAEKSPTGLKPVERSSMEGTWILERNDRISQQGHLGWMPTLPLKISKSKTGEYVPRLLGDSPQAKAWKIVHSDVSDKSAHLVLSNESQQFDVRVELDEVDKTEALGNLLASPTDLRWTVPARLLAVSESDLRAIPSPTPHKLHEEFNRVMDRFVKQQEPEAAEEFIQKHPRNPLSFFAIFISNPLVSLRTADDPRPDIKEIRAHLKRLDKLEPAWGRRAALLAKLELAHGLFLWRSPNTGLIRKNASVDIALEIVRAADTPESRKLLNDAHKARLAGLKQAIEHEQHVVTALSTRDARSRSAAMAEIDRFLETAPRYQPWVLYALAEANRNAGSVDKALEQYARLLVMPSASLELQRELESRWRKMPDLRKRLEELWTKKRGAADGLDEYLAQTYRKVMNDILPDLVATRPPRDRKRMHLCELFTSCDDAGSVGADVATQIVQRTHNPVDVVVLRYHLDDPQPNPLVCNDSKLRAFDCQVASPPMVLVNGKPLTITMNGQPFMPDLRSSMAGVPYVAALVRRAIRDDSAAESPRYRVRVSASAQSGKLVIKAKVDGPMTADPDLRLRIVLAEDRIPYTGKNGIRYHDMVVRSMPGGIDGVPLSAGKTTFAKTFDLADLSARLRDFLTSLEEKSTKQLKLSVKPVDFKKLHVVAFVQRTKRDREVLQVAQTVVDRLQTGAAADLKKPAGR